MRVQKYLIAFLVILFTACSTTKEYYLDPEFEQEKVSSSILIVPVQESWFEEKENLSHTFGKLSGTAEKTFYTSLEKLMSQKLRSKIKMAGSDQTFKGDLFKSTILNSGNNSLQVMLPLDDKQFDLTGYEPEIVLLLDQFYYFKREQEVGGLGYAGHESKSQNLLYFETKYMYWNTENSKPVAWGSSYASKKISGNQVLGLSDYREVLSKAMDKLIKQGPVL